jgi:hypothetical protein
MVFMIISYALIRKTYRKDGRIHYNKVRIPSTGTYVNTNLAEQSSNRKRILGSLIIGIGLCALLFIGAFLAAKVSGRQTSDTPVAKIGIVPYVEPTATLPPTLTPVEPTAVVIDGIQIGSSVQISGTEGAGLKIRHGFGINSVQKFIALDSEIYEVVGGPEETDGYVWWELSSAYDTERNGWAVSAYLTPIK